MAVEIIIKYIPLFLGGCGSCYAFSSAGMNEARLRVVTKNTVQLVFSPQDIVECSEYSQGQDLVLNIVDSGFVFSSLQTMLLLVSHEFNIFSQQVVMEDFRI